MSARGDAPPPSTRFAIITTVVLLGSMLAFVAVLVLVGGYALGAALTAVGVVTDLALQLSGHLLERGNPARDQQARTPDEAPPPTARHLPDHTAGPDADGTE
ncbi:hypothetical protein DZF91_19755 [Actinomadura logoneensis]|uniref:Uncharacterized protein n=1 Tax=Actinomadura logoneensis TaxID=2293572 RepID=A0A372JKS2_9ACTN|nr:hypothetical protein [Actinomadura logoneensis]RFU39928.1 hypothetical protein DZF91_19755 [Actinomadura logoneensis]